MNDAYKQVGIALSSIEQATENLRIQTDYYGAGTCTMSEWLDAQTLFQQSRDKYVEAYAQYEVKKREYMQATGRWYIISTRSWRYRLSKLTFLDFNINPIKN